MPTRTFRKWIVFACSGLAALVPLTALAAPGALLRADRGAAASAIAPAQLERLTQDVRAWRTSHPRSFALVAGVKGCSADTYQSFRRPEPTCTRELRALGAGVALPLWSALLLEAPQTAAGAQPYASDTERAAFASAALDALGTFRLAQNGPLLRALLPVVELNLADEVANALGRTSTVESPAGAAASLQLLGQWAEADGPRGAAAVAGLGQARGLLAARQLIRLLQTSAAQPERAAAVAWALGQNASSWAWQARAQSKAANAAEAVVVRREAAEALLQAYIRFAQPEVREAAMKSLMLAAHPDTLGMVRAAGQGASAEVKTALAYLETRLDRYFARNAAASR